MTSLVSWVGVDSRGPASIYLASDSRISWGSTYWNYGRKLFVSRKYPEILGYYGDVLFPSQVLSRVIDLIDDDLLFSGEDSPQIKLEKILATIQKSFEGYPTQQPFADKTFAIAYCTRENAEMSSIFHFSLLIWDSASGWQEKWLNVPSESGIIEVFGSGKKSVTKWYSYWSKTKEARTSRSVFSAFCDALNSNEDHQSGGAPQLVGLYRKGLGQTFGIIYKGERYIFGLPVLESENLASIAWRNHVFEICDWKTKERLLDAQQHRKPSGLGKA